MITGRRPWPGISQSTHLIRLSISDKIDGEIDLRNKQSAFISTKKHNGGAYVQMED